VEINTSGFRKREHLAGLRSGANPPIQIPVARPVPFW
jgi:hypothetical protein